MDGISPLTHGIRGLASVFGNLDSYDTVIDRGAFARMVARSEAGERFPVAYRHSILRDPVALPIGLTSRVRETKEGLYYETGPMVDTQEVRDLMAHVEGGTVTDASFSFLETRTYNERERRVVRRSALYDGPWGVNGGDELWDEYAEQAGPDSDAFRLVLSNSDAQQMLRRAQKIKDYEDGFWGVGALAVREIQHIADLDMKELGPAPLGFGANPKAYTEIYKLSEESDQTSAPLDAATMIADALAAAAQEIAK
jgi:HK97 family phage prohead protease